MDRKFKSIKDAIPHTTNKIYAEGFEDRPLHSVIPSPVFTTAETAQLMRMYAHARYRGMYPKETLKLWRDKYKATGQY